LGLPVNALPLLPLSLHLVNHAMQQRNLVLCVRCLSVRFANHLGPILSGWNDDDRSGTSSGSWGLPGLLPFSASLHLPPHRALRTNVLLLEGHRFSAPGGRGPSLEACSTPSRGPELLATCSLTTLPLLSKFAAPGKLLLAMSSTGCGSPGRLRDLPANSTSAEGGGRWT
jgi:hypothetical protein